MKEIKESLKKKCDEDIQELATSSFHSIFGNSAPKTSTGEATLKAAWEEALPKCTSMP